MPRKDPQAIELTADELAGTLMQLPVPLVITKNKHEHSAENFRPAPRRRGVWLDGDWTGTPKKVSVGTAMVAHYVERDAMIWFGRYLGNERVGESKRYFLVLDMVRLYKITDLASNGPSQAYLRSVLNQEGPPTYSYHFSPAVTSAEAEGLRQEEITPARYREVLTRLEQPAFRRAVLAHHGSVCVITGCTIPELLDAAHLPGRDWRAGHNSGLDGIPLRTDIHRALDRGLISLDEQLRLVIEDPRLEEQYAQYRAA
jgi:putative restriction endonuclease